MIVLLPAWLLPRAPPARVSAALPLPAVTDATLRLRFTVAVLMHYVDITVTLLPEFAPFDSIDVDCYSVVVTLLPYPPMPVIPRW